MIKLGSLCTVYEMQASFYGNRCTYVVVSRNVGLARRSNCNFNYFSQIVGVARPASLQQGLIKRQICHVSLCPETWATLATPNATATGRPQILQLIGPHGTPIQTSARYAKSC